MPQLDIFAFRPVVTWLLILLFLLYNIVLATGLPRIYKVLSYRKKKLFYYNTVKEDLDKENYYGIIIKKRLFNDFNKIYKNIPDNLINILEKNIEIEKELLLKKENNNKNWLDILILGINNENKEYKKKK
jgi:hypothetical protein